jgi:iron complex outermembrane recepter protein
MFIIGDVGAVLHIVRIHTELGGNAGKLSLRTDAYSQSNFYFSNTNNSVTPGTGISPYTLVNFRLALEGIEGSGWSIAAQLRNAFNRTYYVGGSPLGSVFSVNTAVPGVPRMFYLEANYKF